MKFRKLVVLLLALLMFTSSAMAWGEKTNAEKYADAEALLQQGEYSNAATAFADIGDYSDSYQMAMYCSAIAAGESGLYSSAVTNLQSLGAFRDAALLATYYAGRSYEDAQQYETAQEMLAGMTFYRDVASRIASYPEKINARDYAAADAAEKSNRLEIALSGFNALGSYSDSATRAETVQQKIYARDYAAADSAEQSNELETALAGFKALGSYSDSADRAAAVQVKIDERDAAAAEAAKAAAYAAADAAEQQEDYATAYSGFVALGDYLDSASRAAAVQDKGNYAQGIQYALAGKFAQAYSTFEALGTYEDSADKAYVLGVTTFATVKDRGNGVAAFQFHDLWGIINVNTNTATSPYWDSIGDFNELGLAVVSKNSLYGYINTQGEVVVSCDWYAVSAYSGSICTVAKKSGNNYLFGLVDAEGNIVSEAQWQTLGDSSNGSWDSKYNSCYARTPFFSDGKIKVQNAEGKWGFVGNDGQLVGEVIWDEIQNFSEGLAVVSRDKKYGFIDKQGQVVIEPQYTASSSFHEGLAAVKVTSGWQYINQANEVVIQPLYSTANDFNGGKADVFLAGTGWQIIDNTGSLLYFVSEQTMSNYATAVGYLESGDYAAAYSLFKSLAGYKDSNELMQQARTAMVESGDFDSRLPEGYSLAPDSYSEDITAFIEFFDESFIVMYSGSDEATGATGTTASILMPGSYTVSVTADEPVSTSEIAELMLIIGNTASCNDANIYISDIRMDGISVMFAKGNTYSDGSNYKYKFYPIVDLLEFGVTREASSWDGVTVGSYTNLLDASSLPATFSTIEIDFSFGVFVK